MTQTDTTGSTPASNDPASIPSTITLTAEEKLDYAEYQKQYYDINNDLSSKIMEVTTKFKSGGTALFDAIKQVLESHNIHHLSGERFIAIFYPHLVQKSNPSPSSEPSKPETPTTTFSGNIGAWGGAYHISEPANFTWDTLFIDRSTGGLKLSKDSKSKEYLKVSATVDDTGVWYSWGDETEGLYKVQITHSLKSGENSLAVTVQGTVKTKKTTTTSSGASNAPASNTSQAKTEPPKTNGSGGSTQAANTPSAGNTQPGNAQSTTAPSTAASKDFEEKVFKAELVSEESGWDKFKKNGGLGYCIAGLITLAMLGYGLYKLKQGNKQTKTLEDVGQKLIDRLDKLEQTIRANAIETLVVRAGGPAQRGRFAENVQRAFVDAHGELVIEIQRANEAVGEAAGGGIQRQDGPAPNPPASDNPGNPNGPRNPQNPNRPPPNPREIELVQIRRPMNPMDVVQHSSTVSSVLDDLATTFIGDEASGELGELLAEFKGAGVDPKSLDDRSEIKPDSRPEPQVPLGRIARFAGRATTSQLIAENGFMSNQIQRTVATSENKVLQEQKTNLARAQVEQEKARASVQAEIEKYRRQGGITLPDQAATLKEIDRRIEEISEHLKELDKPIEQIGERVNTLDKPAEDEKQEFQEGTSVIEPWEPPKHKVVGE